MARLHHALFTGVGNNTGTVPSVSGSQMAVGGLQNPDGSGAANPSLVGMSLILSGGAHSGNNGTFTIIQYESPFEVIVYNPSAVSSDSVTWQLAFNVPAAVTGLKVVAVGGGGGGGGSGGCQGAPSAISTSGAGGAGALVTERFFDAFSAALGGNAAAVLVAGPTVAVTGLTNMSPAVVGYNLTISGSSVGANNGSWVISAYNSPTSVNIINGSAAADTGSDTWSVGIIPGLAIPVVVGAGGTRGAAGTAGSSSPTNDGGIGGVGGNSTVGGIAVALGAQGGAGGRCSNSTTSYYAPGGNPGQSSTNTTWSTTPSPVVWAQSGAGGIGAYDPNYAVGGSDAIAAIGGGTAYGSGGTPGVSFNGANGGGGGGAGAFPGTSGGEGGTGGHTGTATVGQAGGFGGGGGGGGGITGTAGPDLVGIAGGAGGTGCVRVEWTA